MPQYTGEVYTPFLCDVVPSQEIDFLKHQQQHLDSFLKSHDVKS